MVEVLALEIAEVEFVGDHRLGDVLGELRIALDRRNVARAAAFVGRAEALTHAQREVAVVVEERGHVVVVDIDQHVGPLVAKPLLDRRIAFEDRLPHRVLHLVRVLGEGDGGSVRSGDAADDGSHGWTFPLRGVCRAHGLRCPFLMP